VLGLWDGNPVKLDCDDHSTTTEVIDSLSNKKKEKKIVNIQKIESATQKGFIKDHNLPNPGAPSCVRHWGGRK